MNKEKDEQEIRILNNAQTAGVIVVVIICLFFLVTTVMVNGRIGFDYIAIMFVYLSVVCFYSFAKFKNIYHLVIGFGFLFVFICTLILFFINI